VGARRFRSFLGDLLSSVIKAGPVLGIHRGLLTTNFQTGVTPIDCRPLRLQLPSGRLERSRWRGGRFAWVKVQAVG
jgi:hypothetical protein